MTQASEDAARWNKAVQSDPTTLGELARRVTPEPDHARLAALADQHGINPDALLFFGRALAAPFVTHAATRLTPPEAQRDTPDGHCRRCASPPGIATLRHDDGARVIHCPLCSSSREFKRIACPHCGCADSDCLTILRVHDEDPRWLEACESCKHYIKTIDARKTAGGARLLALAEDTATLHLDLIAERENYHRNLPYTSLR
jgi:FdhE protein